MPTARFVLSAILCLSFTRSSGAATYWAKIPHTQMTAVSEFCQALGDLDEVIRRGDDPADVAVDATRGLQQFRPDWYVEVAVNPRPSCAIQIMGPDGTLWLDSSTEDHGDEAKFIAMRGPGGSWYLYNAVRIGRSEHPPNYDNGGVLQMHIDPRTRQVFSASFPDRAIEMFPFLDGRFTSKR